MCVVEELCCLIPKEWAAKVDEISTMLKSAENECDSFHIIIIIIIWIMIHIKKHKTKQMIGTTQPGDAHCSFYII